MGGSGGPDTPPGIKLSCVFSQPRASICYGLLIVTYIRGNRKAPTPTPSNLHRCLQNCLQSPSPTPPPHAPPAWGGVVGDGLCKQFCKHLCKLEGVGVGALLFLPTFHALPAKVVEGSARMDILYMDAWVDFLPGYCQDTFRHLVI